MANSCLRKYLCLIAILLGSPSTSTNAATGSSHCDFEVCFSVVEDDLSLVISKRSIGKLLLVSEFPVDYMRRKPLAIRFELRSGKGYIVIPCIPVPLGYLNCQFDSVAEYSYWDLQDERFFEVSFDQNSDGDYVVPFKSVLLKGFAIAVSDAGQPDTIESITLDVKSYSAGTSATLSVAYPMKVGQGVLAPLRVEKTFFVRALSVAAMPPRRAEVGMAYTSELLGNLDLTDSGGAIARYNIGSHATNVRTNVADRIVVYLDPRIPAKFVDAVSRGILEWSYVLSRVTGVPEPIRIARVPNGVDWKHFRAFNNVVEWVQTGERDRFPIVGGTATGSPTVDPRSGEILSSYVRLENVESLVTEMYYSHCPLLTSDLASGEVNQDAVEAMLETLVAHEFGHALGLRDGHFGKYAYLTEQIRSPDFVRRFGFTPSVMNYTRCNNLRKSTDDLHYRDVVPRVGPADAFHLVWGYGNHSEREQSYRQALALFRSLFPEYGDISPQALVYLPKNSSFLVSPQSVDEVVGVRDPVVAFDVVTQTLAANMDWLKRAEEENALPSRMIRRIHRALLNRWYEQQRAVLRIIGGYEIGICNGAASKYCFQAIDSHHQLVATEAILLSLLSDLSWLKLHSDQSDGGLISANNEVDSLRRKLVSDLLNLDRLIRLEQSYVGATGLEGGWGLRPYLQKVLMMIFPSECSKYQELASQDLNLQLAVVSAILWIKQREQNRESVILAHEVSLSITLDKFVTRLEQLASKCRGSSVAAYEHLRYLSNEMVRARQ